MQANPSRIRASRFALLLAALFLAAAGCGRDDSGSHRLEARIQSLFDAVRSTPSPDEVSGALSRLLRTASATGGFPTRETLKEFYARRSHRLAWCDESGELSAPTTALFDALRRASEHGLDPAAYSLDRLEAMGSALGKEASSLADFDLVVTATFFRYASDLSTGRVHPDEVRDNWHTNPPEIDYGVVLSEALEKGDLRELLAALAPPHHGYERLRQALQELRTVAAAGGWPTIPDGPTIAPGAKGQRVALLRQRLAFESADPQAGGSDTYDRALADSVRRFEERHGLDADGKVAGSVLAELNEPVEARIAEIELNLERWRWIPRKLGERHVLVNIPGFDLQLIEGGEPTWRTRVVTGKAYTSTPVFSDRIVGVLVNPPWNVPESIATGEYLPELRKDPKALERHHLRLLQGQGDDAREIDPRSVAWDEVDAAHFPYRIRQDPGPDNALGRVKFELTNEFHIYLHDTPADHLFSRSERDLSHGCIRVEDPVELASRVLGSSSTERLREALDQPEERRLPVSPPVPVHILYWTAWVDEGGLRFGPDVYDLEGPQKTALDRAEKSSPPRAGRDRSAGGAYP